MKSLSGSGIPQLDNITSAASDIKYWINYLLYNGLKINRWNISADTNVGNHDNCVFTLSKMRDIG